MAPNFFHWHSPETQQEDEKVSEPQQGGTGKLGFPQKKSQKSGTRTGQILAAKPKSHLLSLPFDVPKPRPLPLSWNDACTSSHSDWWRQQLFPHNSLVFNSWWWWDPSWQRMLEMTRGIHQQQWWHKASEGYNLVQQSHSKDHNDFTVMMRHGFCEKPNCWVTSSPDSTGREWDICVPSGWKLWRRTRSL